MKPPSRIPGHLVFVLLLACLQPVVTEASMRREPAYGTRIVSLDFRGEGRLDTRALAALTDLTPGQTLTEEAVRTSLRNLFATQRFSDLWIETAVSGDESAVVIAFFPAPRVHEVRITGPDVPSAGRLREAIAVRKGSFWGPDSGLLSERRIERVLKDRGYLEPRIRTLVGAGLSEDEVDVDFEVVAGPRAVSAAPRFEGDLKDISVPALVKAGRLSPGKPFREQRARESASLFTRVMRESGYLRAEVRYERVAYDPASAIATPVYWVFAGPKVTLEIVGIEEGEIRDHPSAPWRQEALVDEDSLQGFAASLTEEFQASGYARARVDVTFSNEPGEEKVRFEVSRGERYAIASIGFRGHAALSHSELLAVIETRPRGLLTSGRFLNRQLASDQNALSSLYREKGYANARILAPEVTDSRHPFLLDVVFPIEEGKKATIRNRRFEGAITIPGVLENPGLSAIPGRPFDPGTVDADVALIRSVYAEKGFVDARIDGVSEPAGENEAGLLVDVVYRIFEGSPLTFGKTVVRGTASTVDTVIRDQFAHQENKPFTFSKLTATEQNLARLGIFERIDMASLPPDPGASSRTVLIDLAESKPWSLLYGIGAEYNTAASDRELTPRISLSISNGNLFGRALLGTIEGRYSLRDSRLLARFQERAIFGSQLPVSLAVFWSRYFRSQFEIERRGTFVEVERRFGPSVKATARLQWEIVNPLQDDPSLEKQDRPAKISSVGSSVTFDRRDDAIDPSRGGLLAADVKLAVPILNTDADFFKVYGMATYVHPLGKLRLAGALRVGTLWNFKACTAETNPQCLPNLEVPVIERFFAGGRSTHRAFPLDDLGIEGETLSEGQGIGGNALVLGNVELRVPVFGGLGLTFFADAGNSFLSPRAVRFGDIRYGAGAGLFYMSPVGPVRLEYGFKLDRKPEEDAGAVNFSIGYPF
ncbi:MAG: BamA/TamA family outer membrane protein [Thermoanaerobaculia bacterium]|nr:BamA/TamA family outer membrane protein [Thermoanaerobaculia bacterium]